MDSKRATTIVQNHSRWSGSKGGFFHLMAVRNSAIIFVVIAAALGLIIVACGGGGGGSSSGSTPSGSISNTVSGTAATGAPIAFGIVSLKDSLGAMLSTTTDLNGNFSLSVSGSTAPFLLKATPSASGSVPYYSFANGSGITNITPLTNLVLFEASGRLSLETLGNLEKPIHL